MADIIRRVWRSGPRKVKRVAWGYTLQVNGRQVRKFNSEWSEEDAQRALAAALLDREMPPPAAGADVRARRAGVPRLQAGEGQTLAGR